MRAGAASLPLLLLLSALAATADGLSAVLRQLRITNQCKLPIIFHEAANSVIAPNQTVTWNGNVTFGTSRISLSYESTYINENLIFLELNGMFGSIGQVTARQNVNFVAQWGFIDLTMDVAFWADSARTRLACQDGRARCLYSASDCAGIPDASARFETRAAGYGFCRSLYLLGDDRGCVGGYAAYVDNKCEVYDRASGTWTRQARSVGYSGMGWTSATFFDGRSIPSTLTGRENNGPAVTYECWEAPCISTPAQCAALGRSSVGNAGFAINCDSTNGLVDIAVLEVTACSTDTTGTATGSATTTIARDEPPPSSATTTVPPAPTPTTSTRAPSTSSAAPPVTTSLVVAASTTAAAATTTRASTSSTPASGATASTTPSSATTTGMAISPLAGIIRSLYGLCLSVVRGNGTVPTVAMQNCTPFSLDERLMYEPITGQIRSLFGLCLEAQDPSVNGAQVLVKLCDPFNANQLWDYKASATQIKARRGNCLDASQRSVSGGIVHLWSCYPTQLNQQWTVGEGVLLRAAPGRCLEAAQPDINDGAVRIGTCSSQAQGQAWGYDAASGQVKNLFGRCLDAANRDFRGGRVHMWACLQNTTSQQWSLEATGLLRNGWGLCLEGGANGTNILRMWDCTAGAPGQNWTAGAVATLALQGVPPDVVPPPALLATASLLSRAGGRAPRGRECDFDMEPAVRRYWEPLCAQDLKLHGCNADGRNVECRFCQDWIFRHVPCPGQLSPEGGAGA